MAHLRAILGRGPRTPAQYTRGSLRPRMAPLPGRAALPRAAALPSGGGAPLRSGSGTDPSWTDPQPAVEGAPGRARREVHPGCAPWGSGAPGRAPLRSGSGTDPSWTDPQPAVEGDPGRAPRGARRGSAPCGSGAPVGSGGERPTRGSGLAIRCNEPIAERQRGPAAARSAEAPYRGPCALDDTLLVRPSPGEPIVDDR